MAEITQSEIVINPVTRTIFLIITCIETQLELENLEPFETIQFKSNSAFTNLTIKLTYGYYTREENCCY